MDSSTVLSDKELVMSTAQRSARLGYRENGKVEILAKCRCMVQSKRLLENTHGLLFQRMRLDAALDVQSILNYVSRTVIGRDAYSYRDTRTHTVPDPKLEQDFFRTSIERAGQIVQRLTKKYDVENSHFPKRKPKCSDMSKDTASTSTSSTIAPVSDGTEIPVEKVLRKTTSESETSIMSVGSTTETLTVVSETPIELDIPEPTRRRKRRRKPSSDLDEWPVLKFTKTMTSIHNKYVAGVYEPHQMYCGRIAYKRRTYKRRRGLTSDDPSSDDLTSEDTFAYYVTSDKPELTGWFIGPTLGGTDFYLYHPSVTDSMPPTDKWNVRNEGTIDKRFKCKASGTQQQPRVTELFFEQSTRRQ